MVKKVYSVATLLFNVLALLFALAGSMFKMRSRSTVYLGGHGSVSKGDWHQINIFEETPWLAVLIIISSLTLIVFSLIFLLKKSELSSKLVTAAVIVLFYQFVVGIIAFFTPFGLSSSSTSGYAGAWSSSGTSVELAGMGWLYILCSIGSGVACFAGLWRRE